MFYKINKNFYFANINNRPPATCFSKTVLAKSWSLPPPCWCHWLQVCCLNNAIVITHEQWSSILVSMILFNNTTRTCFNQVITILMIEQCCWLAASAGISINCFGVGSSMRVLEIEEFIWVIRNPLGHRKPKGCLWRRLVVDNIVVARYRNHVICVLCSSLVTYMYCDHLKNYKCFSFMHN